MLWWLRWLLVMCYNMMYYKPDSREDSVLISRSSFVARRGSSQQLCDVFVAASISAVTGFVFDQQNIIEQLNENLIVISSCRTGVPLMSHLFTLDLCYTCDCCVRFYKQNNQVLMLQICVWYLCSRGSGHKFQPP